MLDELQVSTRLLQVSASFNSFFTHFIDLRVNIGNRFSVSGKFDSANMSSETQSNPPPALIHEEVESGEETETEESHGQELSAPRPDRGSWSGSQVSRVQIEWLRASR